MESIVESAVNIGQRAVIGGDERDPDLAHARESRVSDVVTWTAIAIGIALRVWQYALNRGLWIDEAKLAVGIIRPWSALLEPLPMQQTAPLGFVILVKSAISVFGVSEWAFRIWPFVFGIAALLLFVLLARTLLPRNLAPLAIALFAFVPIGIYYSSELKQYSLDLFFAVLLTLLVVRDDKRSWFLVTAGFIAPWMSYASIFVVAGLGVWLLWKHHRILIPSMWALSSVGAIVVARLTTDPATAEYMRRYWAAGMVPHDASGPSHVLSLLIGSFGSLGTSGLALLGFVLAALGCIGLGRRSAVLLLPVAATMLAAVAHAYPFGDPLTNAAYPERLILFLLPAMCLLIIAGVGVVARHVPDAAVALCSYVMVVVIFAVSIRIPDVREDIRPLMSIIAQERTAGDNLYLGAYAASVFAFYGPRYGLSHMRLQTDPRSDAARRSPEPPDIVIEGRTWVLLARHHPVALRRLLADLGPRARLVGQAHMSALVVVE